MNIYRDIFKSAFVPLIYFMLLVAFYFPLKTREKLWFSDIFKGYKKRPAA